MALANAGGVEAAFVLRERICMAELAGVGALDGVLAGALDVARCRRMIAGIDGCVAAGAPEDPVNRSRKTLARNVQGKRFAVFELLLQPFDRVTTKTGRIGLRERAVRGACGREGNQQQ